MESTFGMKTIEKACIKATNKIEINGKIFQPGEVIAYFDQVDFLVMQEDLVLKQASGGYNNRALIFWETKRDVLIQFSKGVFSKNQFAIVANSKIIYKQNNTQELIHYREELESDENGSFTLKYPAAGKMFVYDRQTGEKLNFTGENENYSILNPYKDIIVDYEFSYWNGVTNVTIGNNLIDGFVSFEGKTKIKDDETGVTHTGIIRIPKMKLVSQLAIQLGDNNDPFIANFRGLACPTGVKGDNKIIEFLFLEDDLYSDF